VGCNRWHLFYGFEISVEVFQSRYVLVKSEKRIPGRSQKIRKVFGRLEKAVGCCRDMSVYQAMLGSAPSAGSKVAFA